MHKIAVPLFRGAGSPSNTMSPGPRQLPPCQVTSWSSIHPVVWPQQTWAENWGVPLWGEEAPSNTMWPRSRPTSLPSDILILDPSNRLATTDMGQKLGAVPFGEGELCPHLTQCGRCWGLPLCQVSSNRVATVRQRFIQTDRTTVR